MSLRIVFHAGPFKFFHISDSFRTEKLRTLRALPPVIYCWMDGMAMV